MKSFFLGRTVLYRVMAAAGIAVSVMSCARPGSVRYALRSAGDNRAELEAVLRHYRGKPDRLKAAEYLIAGLPAHRSYAGTEIERYYGIADGILSSELTPEEQRDSLLNVSGREFSDAVLHTVPDAQIVSSDFLIRNIDSAWEQWKNLSWAAHVTFDDFLEWMLPYKMAELQSLDAWRDTLSAHFTGDLADAVHDDVEYGTAMKTGDLVKNEAQREMARHGLYAGAGLPLLSARLLPRQTFGDIPDYALTGALSLRAAGVPVILDETPVGARFEAATRWFVVLGDKGSEEPSEWDLSTGIGWGFFPYERGPKVWRCTYAANPDRLEYQRKAKFIYPFPLCRTDVTARYFLTADLTVPISRTIRKTLHDRYVYIASAVRDTSFAQHSRSYGCKYYGQLPETVPSVQDGWTIVDFGILRHGAARFTDMGREVLYLIYGYDGNRLVPISSPFILHKDSGIEYISSDTVRSAALDRWRNNPLIQ